MPSKAPENGYARLGQLLWAAARARQNELFRLQVVDFDERDARGTSGAGNHRGVVTRWQGGDDRGLTIVARHKLRIDDFPFLIRPPVRSSSPHV
ncbi:MAG: hypothetical protein ABI540_10920 [Spartobacteria bacterium]